MLQRSDKPGAQLPSGEPGMAMVAKSYAVGASFQHIRAIDGLRGVAIMLVLLAHFGLKDVVPGGFGVTLFFFISGMLITRLLIAEYQENGFISIRRFYVRRILRLYPALVLAVALSFGTYAYLGGYVIWKDVAAALFYVSNYYGLTTHYGASYPPEISSRVHIGVLWSLAVEEQYYVVFPFFFAALVSKGRRLLVVMLLIAAFCLGWRIILAVGHAPFNRIYNGTDTRIDSILWGAILTCLLSGSKSSEWLAKLTNKWMLLAAAMALLLSLVIRDPFFRDTLRYSLQGAALMPIVAGLCFSASLTRVRELLEKRPMLLMGAWSYSLYLFHQLALTMAELATGEGYLGNSLSLHWYSVAVPATFAMSLASYYWVEKPFLSLRYRFGSRSA